MNKKGVDQSALTLMLFCVFVFGDPLKTGFLASRPILCQFHVLLLIVLNFTTVDILFYFDRIIFFIFIKETVIKMFYFRWTLFKAYVIILLCSL